MALAITPPGEFGDLRTLQGFKPRFETALRLGPVRIAGKCSQTRRRLTQIQFYHVEAVGYWKIIVLI